MLEISFNNHTKVDMSKWETQATKLIDSVLKTLNLTIPVNLSINFVDKVEALKMNQEFRHEQYVPDVISFPSGIELELAEQIGVYELGDLFICFEVANQKAEHYDHDIVTEMGFLFVHGTLHLLGYDHELETDKEVMFDLQDQILKANGIDYTIIYDELDYLEQE